MRLSLSLVTLWILLLGAGTALAQNGYDLFHQALLREKVEGDLEGTIELYQRIVEEHGENRPLAAKALVQMGQCWEKLGRAEARQTYERVLRDYADQPEQVSAAQARLAALTRAAASARPSTMLTRRVWQGRGGGLGGSLAPDGRHFTFTDWTTGGDLAVLELPTGRTRRLTDQRSSPEYDYAWSSAISPDGRRVVFQWWDGRDKQYEIRTVGFDGSEPRVLYANEEVNYPLPLQWSPER